jgi:hypothetical protein
MTKDPTIFNRDGTISRKRKYPCGKCGAITECDECWEHVSDYSPFYVWHCFLCRMPQAGFKTQHRPHTCDFCGFTEKEVLWTPEL